MDDAGNVLAGATVTITNEATGTAATIYSDRNGSVPLTNPFTTGSDGLARFYAAAGEYRVQASLGGTAVDWRYQVLTGTAARSDVTTSSTDTTAGRLLKVGDFGLGVSNDYTGSLDNINVTSLRTIYGANVTGAPSGFDGSSAVASINTTYRDANYATQIFIGSRGIFAGKVYRRIKDSGTWSSWQEILHTGNTKGLTGYGDAATDFNTQTVNGFYKGSGISAGVPYTGNWEMIQNQFDANSGFQIMADAGAATVEMYARVKSAGNWQSHVEILHTGNMVGTVNSSKTGAIIERGSNVNGEYVKFADGTLICWYVTPLISPANMTVQGSYHVFGNWTFPVQFASGTKPSVRVTGSHSGVSTAGATFATSCLVNNNINVSQIIIQHIVAGQNLSVWAHFKAVGRWYN